MKPTKEQFETYLAIRDSGATNMFDVRTVCELSWGVLTRENCLYIMKNFDDLCKEYNIQGKE